MKDDKPRDLLLHDRPTLGLWAASLHRKGETMDCKEYVKYVKGIMPIDHEKLLHDIEADIECAQMALKDLLLRRNLLKARLKKEESHEDKTDATVSDLNAECEA